MLAKIIGAQIVKHLSEYCQITEEQISLSVFSGKGSLDNLVLKPEAFTAFDLPVAISRAVRNGRSA